MWRIYDHHINNKFFPNIFFLSFEEQRAKLENWPPKDDDDDEEEDLKQREEQSESKLFLSVDEKMKTEDEKDEIEQPGANHAKSVRDVTVINLMWYDENCGT